MANLETRSETSGRKSVLELCRLGNISWDNEPKGKLTAASPVVRLHFFLANGIDNRTHVGSCLRSIYLGSVFSYNIIAHCSSMFCVSIHFARPKRDVPVVAWFLRCSLHFTDEAAGLRDGAIDPMRIEADKVEVLSYNLIQLLSCSPEVVYPACYEISIIVFCLGRIINVTSWSSRIEKNCLFPGNGRICS
jgi:hypothetical protein